MQPESCALLPNDSKDTQDTLMHNMEPKNARLLYSITVAAAGSLLKRHTNNSSLEPWDHYSGYRFTLRKCRGVPAG